MSIVQRVFEVNGVPTDMTTVTLSDSGITYGVKRNDSNAVVVAAGVSMTKVGTGLYQYEFTDPAYGLTYTYSIKFTYNGQTYYVSDTLIGPTAAEYTGGTTLYTLRQEVARIMGSGDAVLKTGTPAATFATTGFQCADLALDEDDFYSDWYLRFYSGTHKDTTRRVTDFTQVGGVIVFSPAVTGAVDATDLFELIRDYSPEEINNAINLAIQMIADECLEDKLDETLTLVEDVYEYAVPSGFYTIDAIYQGDEDDNFYPSALIDSRYWKIISKSGTKYIWLDAKKISLTPTYKLRLTGQALPLPLTLDASTTNIPAAYLVQQAKSLLHQARITGGDKDINNIQMGIAQKMADLQRPSQIAPRGWKV